MIKFRIILLLFLFLGIPFSCVDEKNRIIHIDEDTFEADKDNENIKLAIKEAQKNLDFFISELQKNVKDTNYWFSVKAKFEDNQSIEHLWLETIEYREDIFKAVLINEPYGIKEIKKGDTIQLNRLEVEDWSVENELKGIHHGDYTERFLFSEEQ